MVAVEVVLSSQPASSLCPPPAESTSTRERTGEHLRRYLLARVVHLRWGSGGTRIGYPPPELEGVPDSALRAFTGIGTPVLSAELGPGEDVLDLACGSGLDPVLAARLVVPAGRVYEIDRAPGCGPRAGDRQRGSQEWSR